jgi:hypothetical protein
VSIVKVRLLGEEASELQFEVFMARLRVNTMKTMDVTINWRNLLVDNRGVFYTDSNSWLMVKRDISNLEVPRDISPVPSYYYPITSGIFIEDHYGEEQMIVTNDRPQGGSAYSKGRIELMINRYGTSIDHLGVSEGVKDTDYHGFGLNISAKFHLAFTRSRYQALNYI